MPQLSSRVVANERDVKYARPCGDRAEYRVKGMRQLVLRVSPTGGKNWSFHFRHPRERRWRKVALGSWPAIALVEAKEQALRLMLALRDGKDPRRQRAKVTLTFREVADAYIAQHESDFARNGEKSRWTMEVARILNMNVLPEIGHRSADAGVARGDISKLVEKVARRGAKRAADHTFGVVRAVYGWANDSGLLDSIDPTRGLKKRNGTRSRSRVLTDDEIRRLWHRLDQPSPLSAGIRVALKLQILLGVRIAEATSAAVSDFDLVKKVWTIPRTKNGHEHRLPLPDVVVQIIKEQMARGDRWLCPSPHDDGPIRPKSASRAVLRIQRQWQKEEEEGRPNIFRTHDFRRTCATRLGEAGVSDAVIARILNHTPTSVTGIHYNHAVMWAAMREALDAWSTEVMRIVGITSSSSVRVGDALRQHPLQPTPS